MLNFSFETFVGNFSFVLLFLIMILYWFQAIFSIIRNFNFIIFLFTICANFNLIFLLTIRWYNYKHFPLSNLYESLIFLSWSFTLIQLILLSPKFYLNEKYINQPVPIGFSENSLKETSSNSYNTLQSDLVPPLKKNQNQTFNTKYQKQSTNLKNISFVLPIETTFKKKFQTFIRRISNNFQIILNFFRNIFSNKFSSTLRTNNFTIIVGTILSPMALFINSFATFSLPKSMQTAQALVPALQSNWLMMHVTIMMLSYTALLFGSLLSISFLIVNWFVSKQNLTPVAFETKEEFIKFQNKKQINNSDSLVILPNNKLFINSSLNDLNLNKNSIKNLAKILDNLSYRVLGIGFPLLTIGILSGSVWANEAWGSYWSWDPKETWAFITWLVFAIYLHVRIIKGWEGQKPAILASIGFFVVWVCYLGVNIFGTGLHSYGWLK